MKLFSLLFYTVSELKDAKISSKITARTPLSCDFANSLYFYSSCTSTTFERLLIHVVRGAHTISLPQFDWCSQEKLCFLKVFIHE